MSILSSIIGSFFQKYKFIAYGILATIIITSVTSVFFSLKHTIEKAERLEIQVKQMKDVINEQNKVIKQSKELSELTNKSITDFTNNLDVINKKFESIDEYLNSAPSIAGDRESSEILKETIKKLREAKWGHFKLYY